MLDRPRGRRHRPPAVLIHATTLTVRWREPRVASLTCGFAAICVLPLLVQVAVVVILLVLPGEVRLERRR